MIFEFSKRILTCFLEPVNSSIQSQYHNILPVKLPLNLSFTEKFDYSDALNLESLLTEEEIMIRYSITSMKVSYCMYLPF